MWQTISFVENNPAIPHFRTRATGLARHCKTLGVEGNKQSKLFLFEKKIR